MHNRDGDIFVNNRQDSGPDASTKTRKARLSAQERAGRPAENNAQIPEFPYENAD